MIQRGLFAIRGRAPRVLNNVLGMVPPAPPALPVHNFIRQRFLVEQFAAQQRAAQLAAQQRAAEFAAQQRAAEFAAQQRAAELVAARRAAELAAQQRAAELAAQQRAAELERQRLRRLEEEAARREAIKQEVIRLRTAFETQVRLGIEGANEMTSDILRTAEGFIDRIMHGLGALNPIFVLEAQLLDGNVIAVEFPKEFRNCFTERKGAIMESLKKAFSLGEVLTSLGQTAASSVNLNQGFKENWGKFVESVKEGLPETFVVAALLGCNKKLGDLADKLSKAKTYYGIAENAFKNTQEALDNREKEYYAAVRLSDAEILLMVQKQTADYEANRLLEAQIESARQLVAAQKEAEEAAQREAAEQLAKLEKQKLALTQAQTELEKRLQEAKQKQAELNRQLSEARELRAAKLLEWQRRGNLAQMAEELQQRGNAIADFLNWLAGLGTIFIERVLNPFFERVRAILP